MHMADALLSPQVAGTMAVASACAAGYSIYSLRRQEKTTEDFTVDKLPSMAVMAALVFAGQMINYTIPGTGSSGHLCGGILLSAVVGPHAGFLSMIAVLVIQCLFFADGGLMALGANIWNMAFYGCFIGYQLIYKGVMKTSLPMRIRITLASVLACVISLQLGAFSVVVETTASGITELPFGVFAGIMLPIHLAIGLVEGLITAAVLIFIYETRSELLNDRFPESNTRFSYKAVLGCLAVLCLVTGGCFSLFASSHPDGLEWSLFEEKNMALDEEDFGVSSSVADTAESIQNATAVLPDYALKNDEENPIGTTLSGIAGSAAVAAAAALICVAGGFFRKKKTGANA